MPDNVSYFRLKLSITHRTLAAIVFLGASGSACLAADAPMTFSDLFGTWRIKRMVGLASISISDKSGRAAVGTIVTISAKFIKTYEKYGSCEPHNPKISEVDTEATVNSEFDTKEEWLDIPRSMLKPRLPFLDAGCVYALILDHDTLLWPIGNGYTYILKRQHRRGAR